MNYHHLSIEERSCIRKYYVDGLSYREIARLVGRNASTISREIRRNCTHMYDIPTVNCHPFSPTPFLLYYVSKPSPIPPILSGIPLKTRITPLEMTNNSTQIVNTVNDARCFHTHI